MNERTKAFVTLGIYAGCMYVGYKLNEMQTRNELLTKVIIHENESIFKLKMGMLGRSGDYCVLALTKFWKDGDTLRTRTKIIARPRSDQKEIERFMEQYRNQMDWKKVKETSELNGWVRTFHAKGGHEEYRVKYIEL